MMGINREEDGILFEFKGNTLDVRGGGGSISNDLYYCVASVHKSITKCCN